MPVTMDIPAALDRYSGGQTRVEAAAADMQSLLDHLWQRFPELRNRVLDRNGRVYPYLLLLRNGEMLPRADMKDILLADGDRVELIALAEGG